MKTVRLKHGVVLMTNKNERGVKLEWGRLGWFGFAVRRDLRGFTLNFFLYWNLHISFAFSQEKADTEVKTYGGMIVLREMVATWQWAWTGGGSEVSKPGTFKEFAYGDAIFGEPVFAERNIGTFKRVLELPEGPYWLEIVLDEGSWKRPRSPFTRRVYRAKIVVDNEGEIPVPTDANGGETGTYGETRNGLKTRNLEKIVAAYKRDLMMERKFVAGDEYWRPKS